MSEAFANDVADIEVSPGHTARVMWVSPSLSKLETLRDFGFKDSEPILVLIGGASLMAPELQKELQPFFNRVLAPLAQMCNITVLDGGTDAGVISMMGQARAVIKGSFRLMGVVPRGKAKIPGIQEENAHASTHNLEINHTHFFLIPGNTWGTESPWLTDFATLLANDQPSLTLLVNGGETSLKDLRANLEAGRLAVVLAGSGRLADRIAVALAGNQQDASPEILDLVDTYGSSGKLISINISTPMLELLEQLKQYFTKAI